MLTPRTVLPDYLHQKRDVWLTSKRMKIWKGFAREPVQATWHRLAPFFPLPGRITWGSGTVRVELRQFNDRWLTRDLALLCQQVQAAQPRLPDGRMVILRIAGACCPTSPAPQRKEA